MKSLFKRLARSSKMVVATTAILAMVGLGTLGGAVAANALSVSGQGELGPGFGDDSNGFVGAYLIGGQAYGYCAEGGIDPGPTRSIFDSGSVIGAGGTLRSHNANSGQYFTDTITTQGAVAMNLILSKYGQTNDAITAASVQMAIWAIGNPSMWNSDFGGYTGEAYFLGRVPSSVRPDITGLYRAMVDEGMSAQPPGPSVTGSANIDITMTNGYNGTLRVQTTPTNATGTVTLTGAKFLDGTTTKAATNGSALPIIGTPLDTNNTTYQIAATGSFSASVGGGFNADITLHSPNNNGQLIMTAGTPGQTTIYFNANRVVIDPVITFSPVVSTVAPDFVQEGEHFSDKLFASVANPTAPASNQWRKYTNGNFVPIVAKGTLYGPINYRPTPSATAPDGIPIVTDGISVSLTGPGEYDTPELPDLVASESGFYTWVWTISYADQGVVAKQSIPANYSYVDPFGQVVETTVVPTSIVASTNVVQPEASIFAPVQDKVNIALTNGSWLTADRSRIPVTMTGEAYFYPGDTPPALSDDVPAEAVLVDTVSYTTDRVGETTSDSVYAPGSNGFLVWKWSVRNADQPEQWRGYFKEWTDQFGIASEMTRISVPSVTTQATAESALTDGSKDTALVNGNVPPNSTVTFEAYRAVIEGQPKVDAAGNAVVDVDGKPVLWTAEEIAEYKEANGELALCTAQPVFTSPAVPVTEGENVNQTYSSAYTTFKLVGTYYWVESLNTVNPNTDEPVTIHRGECGLPNETTVVTLADIKTKATPEVEPGAEAFDTAIVNGQVAEGSTIVFSAYREVRAGDVKEVIESPKLDEDGNPILDDDGNPVLVETEVLWTEAEVKALTEPICSVATRVFDTSDSPVAVTPGLNENAEYKSPTTKFATIGSYFWVERYLDRDKNVLHEGVCGEPSETTKVVKKPVEGGTDQPGPTPTTAAVGGTLPTTGSDDIAGWIIGGISIALVAAGAGVFFARRRLSASAE